MAKLNDLYPSKYLSAADLKGQEVNAVIDRVEIDDFDDNGRKVQKPVVYFKGGQKGLVANKTNSMSIVEICGNDDTDQWAGVSVVLYPTMVQFGAKMTEAIRVKAPGANDVSVEAQKPVEAPATAPEASVSEELNDSIPF